jgi:serine/threonine protein kinase
MVATDLFERIGSGGAATVHCADDSGAPAQGGPQSPPSELADDHRFVERFRRDPWTAASLHHPHIVTVYGRGESEAAYYIVMEYGRGRSLRSLVEQEAPLQPSRATDLMVQVLEAAGFTHRRGIIHRDVESENVLADDGGCLKVTDFGIASPGPSDNAGTGIVLGTASYLSPEQALGGVLTAPSDRYSIAIILYELVVRRVPFEGDHAVRLRASTASNNRYPPAASARPSRRSSKRSSCAL